MSESIKNLLALYRVDNSRETTDAMAECLRVAVEALEYANKACLCERFKTKGFDYHQKHKNMGESEAGSRWLTPNDKITYALQKIQAIAEGNSNE